MFSIDKELGMMDIQMLLVGFGKKVLKSGSQRCK